MKIGCDVDGVLADFNTGFIERVIAVTGRDLFPPRPFDIPTWDYPQHYGYSNEQADATWVSVNADPLFWERLPPYAETAESLRVLGNRAHNGDEVYYITSRPGINSKRQTETWLRKHGLADRPTVLISSQKGLCAMALELDAYLDDRWENALDVAKTATKSYLLRRPWNRLQAAAANTSPVTCGVLSEVDSVAEFVTLLG